MPTICIYRENKLLKKDPRKKVLYVGEGAGRQYSQRSEAKQLLESVNLNFIDFVMSQVSEMTEVQRLISKSLVSKTSLLRTFTEGIPALNQRNT